MYNSSILVELFKYVIPILVHEYNIRCNMCLPNSKKKIIVQKSILYFIWI